MTIDGIHTIGLIGAGKIGGQVARAVIDAGYDVVISNSRGPETLSDLVAELGPQARAATAAEAAEAGDLVVVSVPFKAIPDVPSAPLAGKTVVDTTNYYPQRDGQIADLDTRAVTSSELLQRHLAESRVVKAFNHIAWNQITSDATPPGTTDRRALVVAGDDAGANAQVIQLLAEIGFDIVDIGPLNESWRIQPGTPGYGPRLNADEMSEAVVAAVRAATR
jgi:predicted dinucleotide-binding enzyme